MRDKERDRKSQKIERRDRQRKKIMEEFRGLELKIMNVQKERDFYSKNLSILNISSYIYID